MVPLFRPRSFSGTAGAKPQVLFFGGPGVGGFADSKPKMPMEQ